MTDINFTHRWKRLLANALFRIYLLIGLLFGLSLMLTLPKFFNYIERRNGIVLNDALLDWLPPIDVSIPVFIILWGMFIFLIIRAILLPELFIKFLWSLALMQLSRVFTISLVPLNTPPNLIILIDPISSHFYKVPFITKDLFYSGHTATMFLMFLCFKEKWERGIALIATILMGILVLVQHIHYTVDVVTAPFFSWLIFLLAKRVLRRVFKTINYIE